MNISLFPLANILKCVVCLLLLLVCAQSLSGALEGSRLRGQATAAESRRIEADRLRGLLGQESRRASDLEKAATLRDRDLEAEFRELERKIAEEQRKAERVGIALADAVAVRARLDAARSELAIRREQLGHHASMAGSRRRKLELETALAAAQKQLDGVKSQIGKGLEAPVAPAGVSILPAEGVAGSGSGAAALFVECTASGIVVIDGTHPTRQVSLGKIGQSADFAAAVDTVARAPDRLLVLLVRPNGIPAHDEALNVAISQKNLDETKLTHLPVPGDGPLDLTAFGASPATTR